ncbi:MAG: glycosyltransferase family 9 protein [Planctomycetia bacterium]|nr:glycosyltransferase family 9 protein [Planctomycetia bacterium]
MNFNNSLTTRYRFVRARWRWLFAVVDAIGAAWLHAWRRVFGEAAAKPLDPEAVGKILLIQLDHLGDAVMTTSMFASLKRRFPQATIDVLAAPWNCEVFAASKEIGRIYVSRWNRFRRNFKAGWPFPFYLWAPALRARCYDLAIDVRGDFPNAVLMRLCGIPRRVGWACAGGGFLLTDSAEFVRGRHEVDSRRALLAALGADVRSTEGPKFVPSSEAIRFVTHMLGEFRQGSRPLWALHVGAGTSAKAWPVKHWRELLGRAIVERHARVILVGGQGDVETGREITQEMFWPGVMDWTGRLTLDQLASLVQRTELFIGADSGPAHLAAATGARVVSLFSGSTVSDQWQPWGHRVAVVRHAVACAPCFASRCPVANHPCMSELTPDDVMQTVRRILDTPATMAPHFLSNAQSNKRLGNDKRP